MQIRLAIEEDRYLISNFQIKMAKETEDLDLEEVTILNGVSSVFHHPHKGKYIVAEMDGIVVASTMLTYEWSDWRNSLVLWIQSVYVLPEYRGNGIFKAIYNYVKNIALEDKNVSGIRLYVDKSNGNAMEVYKAIGMNGEHYKVFEWMKE